MDANKPVGCLRPVRNGCIGIICLQITYGISNSHIGAGSTCIIKHQSGHCSTPVNELPHLHSECGHWEEHISKEEQRILWVSMHCYSQHTVVGTSDLETESPTFT